MSVHCSARRITPVSRPVLLLQYNCVRLYSLESVKVPLPAFKPRFLWWLVRTLALVVSLIKWRGRRPNRPGIHILGKVWDMEYKRTMFKASIIEAAVWVLARKSSAPVLDTRACHQAEEGGLSGFANLRCERSVGKPWRGTFGLPQRGLSKLKHLRKGPSYFQLIVSELQLSGYHTG